MRRPPHRPATRTRTALLALAASSLAVVGTVAAATPADAAARNWSPWGRLAPIGLDLGAAVVTGYAADPNAPRSPIRVAISVDGHRSALVLANRTDTAFGRRHPNYGARHGFLARVPITNGTHRVCATGIDVGLGSNRLVGCRSIVGRNDPVGAITAAQHTSDTVVVTGWALDPNTVDPIRVSATLDGAPAGSVIAAGGSALPRSLARYGGQHGFTLALPATQDVHTICLTASDVGLGSDAGLGCRTVSKYMTVPSAPQQLTTSVTTSSVTAQWAAPAADGGAPVTGYLVTRAGAAPQSVPADATSYTFTGLAPATGYLVSVAAVNQVGAGIAAQSLARTAGSVPSVPQQLQATGTTASSATVAWSAPATNGQLPITGYVVQRTGGPAVTLSATAVTAGFTGLAASTSYTVTVAAKNAVGVGPAASLVVRTAAGTSAIPPQTTPAPVSTSHYIRNLTGVASHDLPLMRAMGARDAGYNPSGHRYLVLQDIGAQSGGGVLLSATTRWVSYPALVAAMKAYLDGYVSTQKANAPLLYAIGTNNDGQVSQAAGVAWADQVIDPVRSYAARYPTVQVAGANDVEPGFSGSVSASTAWLTGFLSATTAPYVFNGSADGCPTGGTGRCNNGWSTSSLHQVAGGAAPSRISVLPQIYNSAMPLQWRWISVNGAQKLTFAGPLTEWTACSQAGSCSSATNVWAWQALFNALASDSRTRQSSMAYGTDLQIN